MNARLSALLLLSASLTLAACSPGERGWCRTAADYTPLAAAPGPRLGRIAVAPARIAAAIPEGFDKTTAEKLITGLFVKDLSSCGRFSTAGYADGDRAVPAINAVLTRAAVADVNGVHKLREATIEVTLSKGGKLLMKKIYSRTWSETGAPDYEKAWDKVLPPAMLEIRGDIIAALSR